MPATFPPRVTLRTLPPVRDRNGGTTPRCLGGCGTATEPGFMACDGCWEHLPNRLRQGIRRWHRLTPDRRQVLVLEVEALCTRERRRAR